jgi:transcriptional/translational regulatory protein YebC/TACO1
MFIYIFIHGFTYHIFTYWHIIIRDVIERQLKKADGAAAIDYKSSVFEFYGFGGVGLLINVLTDNDNRWLKWMNN